MSKPISLVYGDTVQTAPLPPGAVARDATTPGHRPTLAWDKVIAELRCAVREAIHSRRRSTSRVLIVTVDDTRPSPRQLLEPLREELAATGVSTDVLVALGRHRPLSHERLVRHLGTAEISQTVWDDSTVPLRAGMTLRGTPIEIHPRLGEADLVVLLGFVEPTYLAGFSGGPKLVVPGCASPITISFNHSLLFLCGPLPGEIEGNEVYADLCEAAERIVKDPLLVSVPLNSAGAPTGIMVGGWNTHLVAAAACREGLSVAQPDAFDVVIASPGGVPYDVDMVQAKKALPAATRAVKPGGTVILLARCPQGWGPVQPDRASLVPDGEGRLTWLAQHRYQGHVKAEWAALSPAVMFWHVRRKARLVIVTDLRDELEGTVAEGASSLAEALDLLPDAGRGANIGFIAEGRRAV